MEVNSESIRSEPVNELVNGPVKRCIEFIKAQIRNNNPRQHPVKSAGGSRFIIIMQKDSKMSRLLRKKRDKITKKVLNVPCLTAVSPLYIQKSGILPTRKMTTLTVNSESASKWRE